MVYHYYISYRFQSNNGIQSGYGCCQINMSQKLETMKHVNWVRKKVDEMLVDDGLENPSSVIMNWKELKSEQSEGAQAESSESLSKEA